MEVNYFFYLKPVLPLDQKRRFLRLTPEEAREEAKKEMYKHDLGKHKAIVKVKVNSPGHLDYFVIFVEHPSVQKKTAAQVYEDWVRWWEETVWQVGFDDLKWEEYMRIDW